MKSPELQSPGRRQARGMALVLVLVLLAGASLWASANLREILEEERITTRFRQSHWALVAAEEAAFQGVRWWSSTDASGSRNDQRFWGDTAATRAHLGTAVASRNARLQSILEDLDFDGDTVRFSVTGSLPPSGPSRTLVLLYRRAVLPDPDLPPPDPASQDPADPQSALDDDAAPVEPRHGLLGWFEPRHWGQAAP